MKLDVDIKEFFAASPDEVWNALIDPETEE